jgi:putative flavoprotein involved in K+ transport
MTVEQVETLIIGGGQAGLAMSHALSQRGRPHLVLERHRIAERWRTERWDGLRVQFPNWSVRLPGFSLPHTDPDGFATAGAIVDFITAYADRIAAPLRCGVAVTALRAADDDRGFRAETSAGPIAARNVVVATGPYQRPGIPPLIAPDDEIRQLHASAYRNPAALPDGAVLVVGAGASGSQIAEELQRAGRQVYLSIGRHRRVPRRYRGRDAVWWQTSLGAWEVPVDPLTVDRAPPVITGALGGHTIDFRRFAAQGMVLLGHALAVQDGVMRFAPDLAENLAQGDAAYAGLLERWDAHSLAIGLDLPDDPAARAVLPDPPCVTHPILRLDLRACGITTVIWATGYAFDLDWIALPVLDAAGAPVHRRGVTVVPGLYFIGLPLLSRMSSSQLAGEGLSTDSAWLADDIVARG